MDIAQFVIRPLPPHIVKEVLGAPFSQFLAQSQRQQFQLCVNQYIDKGCDQNYDSCVDNHGKHLQRKYQYRWM